MRKRDLPLWVIFYAIVLVVWVREKIKGMS